MSLSSGANDFMKGTQLATPQALLVVHSSGPFFCWSHSSLSLCYTSLSSDANDFTRPPHSMPAAPKPTWSTSPPVYYCACLTRPILMLHVAQFRCKQLREGDSISHPLWYTCFPPSLHGRLLHWFILVLASFIPLLVLSPLPSALYHFLAPSCPPGPHYARTLRALFVLYSITNMIVLPL